MEEVDVERDDTSEMQGARDEVSLQALFDRATGEQHRSLHLSASDDGKTLRLLDFDDRRLGIQREVKTEITVDDLVALIRANGAELPGESVG